jgi:hypothetical protein
VKRLVAVLLAFACLIAPVSSAATKPEISGTTLAGKKLSLSWYRGKWVFLNVWASW